MARHLLHEYKSEPSLFPKLKKLKQDHNEGCQLIPELDSSRDSENSCESEFIIIIPDSEDDKCIEIPEDKKLKAENRRWESEPCFTREGYKYKLIVRPNGLKYNEGYGECIGIWFRPLPSDKDAELSWPARVNLSITVKSFSSSSAFEKDLHIPMQQYTWGRHTTLFRYPAFNFGLSVITHSAIVKAQCLFDDKLFLIIEEFASSL